jgi:hypothetical protein
MNIFTFCGQPDTKKVVQVSSIGYNLSAPDKVSVLPQILMEISDITEVDASSIACIEDEQETVFNHDINKNQLIKQYSFGYKGDYEGLARADKTLYILRSDGQISEITNYESTRYARTTYSTGIPWKDNEGMCFDQKNNRLLIAPKEIPGKDSGYKNKRLIYGFSLSSKKLIKEPVFIFDLSVLNKFALDNKIKVPVKGKKGEKEEPDIKLEISSIGIHPVTGNLFVLSGAEKLLFVFDMKGNIKFLQRLESDLFRQPEGITFMKNGDMFISNEGRKKAPTLVRFNYKPAS